MTETPSTRAIVPLNHAGASPSVDEVLERIRQHLKLEQEVGGNPSGNFGSDDFFTRHVDGALFVSPGSLVAEPGFARYALISTEESPWDATLERVPLG